MLWFLSDTLWPSFWWGSVCEGLAWVRLVSGRRRLCGFRLVRPGWPSCEPSSRTTTHNIHVISHKVPCAHRVSSRMSSVSACPSARAQRAFAGTKESAHISYMQSRPRPTPAEGGGWRVEVEGCCTSCESWQGRGGAVGLLMRGYVSEQHSYLHPTNLIFFFFYIKGRVSFCKMQVSVQCDQEQIYLVSTYLQLTILN